MDVKFSRASFKDWMKGIKYLQVAGGFRSGTNFVRFLVEHNYKTRVSWNTHGWKHAGIIPDVIHHKAGHLTPPVLGVVRNPLSHLLSLHRYAASDGGGFIAHTDWSDYLTSRVIVTTSERGRAPQMRFSNPIQYWNYISWNMMTLPTKTFESRFVRYEDVVAQPEAILTPLMTSLGMARTTGDFTLPVGKMKRLPDKFDPGMAQVVDATAFEPETISNRFTTAQLDFVCKELDPDLMAELSYDMPS